MEEKKDKRYALLIDAENVSPKYISDILDELSKFGIPTYKRVYGNFTDTQLKGWKETLLRYSITPMQQFSNTQGKNASDSALIIDAMDILYSGNVDGFCLVTSDSDFTRLAARLRESGKDVIGMGERKTPEAFTRACAIFKYLEIISTAAAPVKQSTKKKNTTGERSQRIEKTDKTERSDKRGARNTANDTKSTAKGTPVLQKTDAKEVKSEEKLDDKREKIASGLNMLLGEIKEEATVLHNGMEEALINQICLAVADCESSTDDEGWANLADVGNLLVKRIPSFDSRNYGYRKLADLIADIDSLEIKRIQPAGNPSVRIRK